MALIINNKELVDSHEYIELNLNSRTFSSLNNYVVSVAGDNNSQKLTFKFKNQYDNIPLIGTACLLIYYTDWLDDDDPPKPSSGIVNLPMVENEEEGYITAEWVLNKNQTYRDGNCNFGIMFYLPTDEEFYFATDENGNLINNIETIIPQYDNGKVMILEQDELKEYEYYSLNTLTSSFTIVPSALSNQENFNAGTVYDNLITITDSRLDPESENPVQNKTLFELLTVPNTIKKTERENELVITDGVNAKYPLIVNVAQVITNILIDLSTITITENNSGQTAKVNVDGSVNGLYAIGGNINLTMSPHNDVCSLSATYRRSIVTELLSQKSILANSNLEEVI